MWEDGSGMSEGLPGGASPLSNDSLVADMWKLSWAWAVVSQAATKRTPPICNTLTNMFLPLLLGPSATGRAGDKDRVLQKALNMLVLGHRAAAIIASVSENAS